MATVEERAALLAVTCPWCGARPQSECTTVAGRKRRRGHRGPSTLDGHCHDARWIKALGRPAPVLAGNLPPRRGYDEVGGGRGSVAVAERPVTEERPW